jgi:NADH-quinone oxidoreductase subunit J
MTDAQWPYAIAFLLFAAGMWLLLPRAVRRGRRVGAGLVIAGLGLLTLLVHFGVSFARGEPYVSWHPHATGEPAKAFDAVFLALAAITVGSAIPAVTLRSPVYCAIWFAMTLLGTAGLFLYQGAQFLAVATIVVYAGAILVTFLFVLMLAQPQGDSYYDRLSWEAMLSACAGAVMVGMLTMTVVQAFEDPGRRLSTTSASPEMAKARDAQILTGEHVASLGARLFSTHLVAVEVAGTLLLIALVGAIAIVAQESAGRLGSGRFETGRIEMARFEKGGQHG